MNQQEYSAPPSISSMAQQTPRTDAASNSPTSPLVGTSIPACPSSTTPFAAPSLEGWPPASQVPIPPPIRDVVMTDISANDNNTPMQSASMSQPSPLNTTPARTSTPSRTTNALDINSRATSTHPDPVAAIPTEAPSHGAPTRRYLNENVTGVLLEGMKIIAKERPANPLKTLGEYLIERSNEIDRS